MKKIDIRNLTGMLLIAVPSLKDHNFERTVVLICDHTHEGAFGLVINRILLSSFIPLHGGLDIKESLVDIPVFYGGPVKPEQGYVLYSPSNTNYPSIDINKNLFLTTAKEILVDIAAGKGPAQFLFTLGFAGWSPGQLEYEMMIDSWLVAPVDNRVIFDIPVNERWHAAAESIGVDFNRFFCRQGRV
ncbi:MAG: YqgE/AlgH family protein [Nitrospirae bacterium]|jgi:putative transcriptional regulator|nr:YqgE/AlgH family protein [Nitrospirota bacterium]